jgi:opacity protein-like surface antigen
MQRTTNNRQLTLTQDLIMKLKVLLIVVSLAIFSTPTIAAQFEFNPRPTATGQYTDNIFLDGNNEREDYIIGLSPAFDLYARGKTNRLQVSYEPTYQIFKNNDELDSWSHDARLFFRSDFTKRTRLRIGNRFLYTRDPLGDQDVVRDGRVVIPGDPTSRTDREKYYTNALNARVDHQFGREDRVSAAFFHSFLENNDPEREDNQNFRPSFQLEKWFGAKFGTRFRGVYTRGIFDQQSAFTGTRSDDFHNWFGSIRLIGRTSPRFSVYGQYDQIYRKFDKSSSTDYSVYTPSVGFIYAVEKDLFFRLALGAFYQDLDGEDNNHGFYPDASVNKTWNYARGSINLVALSGIDQRNFGSQNLDLEYYGDIRTDATYDFTRKFNASIFGRFRYADIIESDDPDIIKSQFRTRLGAGLAYKPLKWMEFGINYRWSNYAASNDDNWEENRVMFQLTLSPDQPWRF